MYFCFLCSIVLFTLLLLCLKEPKFTLEGDKSWKLVDLQNLSVYFDQELLGDLEGRNIQVSLGGPIHSFEALWVWLNRG